MRTGLTKQEKTTDIWFDEKDPLIYIRSHNTDHRRYPVLFLHPLFNKDHNKQCRHCKINSL